MNYLLRTFLITFSITMLLLVVSFSCMHLFVKAESEKMQEQYVLFEAFAVEENTYKATIFNNVFYFNFDEIKANLNDFFPKQINQAITYVNNFFNDISTTIDNLLNFNSKSDNIDVKDKTFV